MECFADLQKVEEGGVWIEIYVAVIAKVDGDATLLGHRLQCVARRLSSLSFGAWGTWGSGFVRGFLICVLALVVANHLQTWGGWVEIPGGSLCCDDVWTANASLGERILCRLAASEKEGKTPGASR